MRNGMKHLSQKARESHRHYQGGGLFSKEAQAFLLKTSALVLLLAGAITCATTPAEAANPDCALPGVFLCQDWETGWTGVDGPANPTCNYIAAAPSGNPTRANVMTWAAGQVACSFYYLPQFAPRKNIYGRWYQYMSPGWNCTDSYASKSFIANTSRAPSTAWGTGLVLQLSDGVSGKCGLAFRPIRMKPQWDKYFRQNQGRDVDFSVKPDRWYCVEVHVRLNDLNKSNGVIEAWVDNVLVMQYTGMDLSPGDDYFRMWEGTGSKINASNVAISRWTDDLVLSDQRIGCRSEAKPKPSPPTGLEAK